MAQFLVTWFAGVCVSFAQVYVRRSSNTLIVTVKLIWRRGLIFNPTRPLHYVHPGLIPSLSRTTSSRTPNWVCYFKIHCSHQEQSGAVTFASNVTCALPAFARKTPSELTYASALYHTLAIAAHVVLHEVHEASKRRRFCERKCITRTKASVASLPTTKVATECMPDTIVTMSLQSQEMPTCPHQFHEWMVHRTAAIPEQ
jgi:hypothetical protein